jgi:hypothetical protein
MTYARQYAGVIHPDRVTVFGRELVPVTIGHALLLTRIGSPFLVGGKIAAGQLVTAIYVLSRPAEVAARGLDAKRVQWVFKLWAFQLRHLCGALARLMAIHAIEEHLERGWQGPDMWEGKEGSKQCNAPTLLVMKTRLMSAFGVSREQALSYPLREAIWDLAAWAEDKGVDWVSQEDSDMIEEVLKNANKTNG